MRIRYNKVLPILLIVVGALSFFLGLGTAQWLQVILGIILDVLGILMLVNPYVRITETELQVCNPLGMALKRFPLSSMGDLEAQGDVLRYAPDGRKIISLGFFVDSSDVQTLRDVLYGRPRA